MALMKRLFSSIGIGSAKVDTLLEEDGFAPGDTVEAVVKMTGGTTEQHIDTLYLAIQCNYEVEIEGEKITKTATVKQFKLTDPFVLGEGEEKEIPIAFQLPFYTPLSLGATKVWIQTGLDIKSAVDPKDKDPIHVVPDELTRALFDALNELGFQMVETECEGISDNPWTSLPFVQEFEFKPRSGPFVGHLEEVEIACLRRTGERLELMMEVDRKAKGLAGLFEEMRGTDERRAKISITRDDLPGLAGRLDELIRKMS